MPPTLTPEAWAQIRDDYEHTERPLADICDEHGISTGTLRDRVRRWRWTPRRSPIPLQGPPPGEAPAVPRAAAAWDAVPQAPGAEPPAATRTDAGAAAHSEPAAGAAPPSWAAAVAPTAAENAANEHAMVRSLQGAIARVLPAIEATLQALGRGGQHPREMERAARALAALTRTLRELNGLLTRHAAAAEAAERKAVDIKALRAELARRLQALVQETEDERAKKGPPAAQAGETMPAAPSGATLPEASEPTPAAGP
jgi:hypothetical protein